MTAAIARLPERSETPLARAKRTQAEAKQLAMDVAGMLSRNVADLSVRLTDAAALEAMSPGLRDAFRKLSVELESRNLTINQIMGNAR